MKYKTKGFKRAFLLVLVAALLVAAGSVLFWKQVTRQLEQDARTNLISVSRDLASDFTRLISSELQVLTTVSLSLENPDQIADHSRLIAYLAQQNKRNSFFVLGVQFSDGETVFSNGSIEKKFLPASRIESIYEHSYFVSEPQKNPFGAGQVLVLAVPLRIAGVQRAVLFALQTTAFYEDTLNTTPLAQTGLSLIVDAQGNVLLAYPKAIFANVFEAAAQAKFDRGIPPNQMHLDMQAGREGISGYTLRDKHRLSSYGPTGYNGWYAVGVLPTDSMAEKAQSLVLMSLLSCLSVIGILGVLLVFILRMQHQNAKALYKMAFVDPLTKKDNLNAFQLKFKSATENFKQQQMPYALALINIDRFKAINDMYGFKQGDQILSQVATALQEDLSEPELFCRSGADVFLLLLSCPDRAELGNRMEAIMARAGQFCQDGQQAFPITFTCGIYVVDEDTPFFIMFDRANLAWASAKQRAGSHYAFYDREYLRQLVTEKRIEDSMEQALQDREFKLYLQPKCDFKTGRIVSAEALVRWQHPAQGLIPPNWFIPVFEKNAFILKLDLFIFQEVVNLLKQWKSEQKPIVSIGVNFSRLHLDDTQFIDILAQTVQDAGIDPSWIEIELTESVVFGNVDLMKQVIDGLHAKGFSVAMDDFGAGYSSLNVLKNLDFDCVKLDKEFLARGEGNPRMRQVISGLVKMVKDLGSHIVAEGVETKEQAAFLRELGCDTAQGYLYSRPLTVAEFEKRLQEEADQ